MKSAIVALAAVAILIATPASAAIVTSEWTGTLGSGTDQGGLLGVAGADLTGLSFALTFTFDTDRGSFVLDPGHTLEGGVAYPGQGASPGSAVLVISGHQIDFDGGYFSYFGVSQNNGGATHGFSALNAVNMPLNNVGINASISPQLTNSMTTPYSGNPCVGAANCGGAFIFGPAYGQVIFGSLVPTNYTLSFSGEFTDPLPGAVPEPAAWALMLIGFGALGGIMRRRRAIGAILKV